MTEERWHYSPSQVKTWRRCPRQWWWNYHEGLKVPPLGKMVAGRSIHEAGEAHFTDVIHAGPGLEPEAFVARAADSFRHGADEVDWQREGGDPEKGKMLDATVAMAGRYRSAVVPVVGQPVAVEYGMLLDVGDPEELGYVFPWQLECHIDLVSEVDLATPESSGSVLYRVIRDLKCKAKTPKGARRKDGEAMTVDPGDVAQLALYQLGWRTVHGEDLGCVVDYVWRSPKAEGGAENKTQLLPPVADGLLRLLIAELKDMDRSIQLGLFPRRLDSWACKPEECGYWSRCIGSMGVDR